MFLFIFIAVPVVVAGFLPILSRISRKFLPDVLANLCFVVLLAATITTANLWPGGGRFCHSLSWFGTSLNISPVLDGLTLLMLFTISIISLAVGIFSIQYIEKYTSPAIYYSMLLVLVASMNGIVLSSDLFTMYIFIEAAGISSYGLVALGKTKQATEGAFKYLVLSALASSFILLGIAGVFIKIGTTSIKEVASFADIIPKISIILFLAGFGLKCALIPFHFWMPDAYTSAPAVLPAMSSGLFVKVAGVYAMCRVFFNVSGFNPSVSSVMVYLGVISILVGALLALGQSRLRRMLAYSSISQVGYVILAIGIGTPLGIIGGLLHLLYHSIFKALLFLNSGAVEYATGTDESTQLGGLGANMPFTSTTNIVGILSAAGIPPFNGFWSKLIIVIALVQVKMYLYAFIAVFASVLTLWYLLLIQRRVFFGKIKENLKGIAEIPFWMNLSMVGLALACLWTGLSFAPLIMKWVLPAANVLIEGVRTSLNTFIIKG
ncbi:MAG TPA: proton-conducting transporter membrane subunit [bacterium]|nr:proton-conducting transporter membrane subunit [bacterium]HOL35848.1 proton-conducting transporter membrane subunit [bacterium]HPP08105.1 proton-conducting transporter membrane subunit [bacterium]